MKLLLLLINFFIFVNLNSYEIPNTCQDLLPNLIEHIETFETIGDTFVANKDYKNAKKIYDTLSVRKLYQKDLKDFNNPIDILIKDFLCNCKKQNKNEELKCIKKNSRNLLKKAKLKYKSFKAKEKKQEKEKAKLKKYRKTIKTFKNKSYKKIRKELN
jgi:hypothetical protein